jgi:hypothetical protein
MPANATVNGNSYSFVQIETYFGVLPIAGIKDISYNDDLKRADVYGTASVQIGLTRGTYKAEGSIDFYLNAFSVGLVAQFGIGFRQIQTTLVVSYGPTDNGLIVVDTLPMVLIGKIDAANPQSDEGGPITRKVGLIIPNQILWNGVPSVLETFPLIAVA